MTLPCARSSAQKITLHLHLVLRFDVRSAYPGGCGLALDSAEFPTEHSSMKVIFDPARRKSEGRWHESQRPNGTATSDDLRLVAAARALDHLFGSHSRHGHGLEEWPANGNHVPRLQ